VRSLIHSSLTFSVIRKILHKIAFFAPPYGASGATYALYLKVLPRKDVVASFIERMPVLPVKLAFLSHPLWGVRGNVCDSSLARWKAGSRLPICYNSTFFSSIYG